MTIRKAVRAEDKAFEAAFAAGKLPEVDRRLPSEPVAEPLPVVSLSLKVSIDPSKFSEPRTVNGELADVLRRLASRIEEGEDVSKVFDRHSREVGEAKVG